MARLHKPLMLAAIVALLAALWLGLTRLPWVLPSLKPLGPLAHGPLMIAGFLGTQVSLERASALRRRWMYAAPVLSALGGIALIAGFMQPGAVLITLSSGVMVAVFAVMVRQHREPYAITMALGAGAWLVGNGLWLAGWSIPQVVLWWMGFLVLTIAGERLELSRVTRPSRLSQTLYTLVMVSLLLALTASSALPDAGARLTGAGLALLALWLLRYDIARRTVRQRGLTRYIALCLLAGYAWLGIGGLMMVGYGYWAAGYPYDAMLHAIFVGFVLSMIFGHAPLILPSVMGVEVPYHPRFYAHLVLLHASLILRVAGDLLAIPDARRWGGLINVIAVLMFMASTAIAVIRRR